MTEVMEISAIDTYLVRNAVLRKGKPPETCVFAGDTFPTTKHFGIFSPHLIGVISMYENSSPIFHDPLQIQLRGMAILESYQRMGIGKQLIDSCEKHILSSEKKTLIYFNARENAVTFYKKLGYQIIGGIFDVQDVGKHFVMFKKLCT